MLLNIDPDIIKKGSFLKAARFLKYNLMILVTGKA